MKEKTVICIECGNTFTLTVTQQKRIIALKFDEPKRCRDCREKQIMAGLWRHEEKIRHKNVDPELQWEFMYYIRMKRDALLVSCNGSKSSFEGIRPIAVTEDDDGQERFW